MRQSLREILVLLSGLKYRTLDFVDERATGTFTATCSRRDLIAIAQLLLSRDQWADPAFDDVRKAIRERIRLSSNELSKVCQEIQRTVSIRGRPP